MSNTRTFIELNKLLVDTAAQLNLSCLTDSDRKVLVTMYDVACKNTLEATLSHEKFSELDNDVSRSQFFKSINKLQGVKVIERIGGPRESKYKLAV